jgi:hypothetical protein
VRDTTSPWTLSLLSFVCSRRTPDKEDSTGGLKAGRWGNRQVGGPVDK